MNLKTKIWHGLMKYKIIPQVTPEGLVTRLYDNYSRFDKSPRSSKALFQTMEKGIEILEKIGINYSIGRGTLLGHFRDNKFLPGDIDIDIDIISDKLVYEIIKKMPFEIFLVTISMGRYQQLVFIDPETKVLFDIYFYHLINNQYINKHVNGLFKLPKANAENLSSIKINGKNYSSFDPEWFCKYWYGENWKTPSKYSEDWLEFYIRECSGFTYQQELNAQYIELF